MAIQSFQLDPNAQSYTDDQIVGKVNSASAQITRASSVAAAARPLATGEVTGTHIATDAAIPASKLASTAAKDNLDAMTPTARGYIKTNPAAGEFKITGIQRTAAGLADLEYDDVPV